MVTHVVDIIERTDQPIGLIGNDQIIEATHAKLDRIKNKGARATEPSNRTVFDESNPEPEHYRTKHTEIFVKANEEALAAIDKLKRITSRSRSDSLSATFSAFEL